jgi:nanoRNase/pAp phosphatase (c-di-AMP/oligoRNAs hydrolase)
MCEKILCIYHNADLDGACSAAIVFNYFFDAKGASIDSNIMLHGMDYGDDFPWSFVDENEMTEEDRKNCVPYAKVVMVDFSLREKDMERLNSLVDLIWIDHHASVVNRNKDIQGVRDIDFAACELTYMYFHTGITYSNIPLAVRLLGRYDVWDHTDKRTIPFQYGMCLHNLGPYNSEWNDKKAIPFQYGMRLYNLGPYNSEWLDLLEPDDVSDAIVKQIINNGEIIEKYQSIQDRKYVSKYGFIASLEYEESLYKVLCLNKGFCNSSVVKGDIRYTDSIDLIMTFVQCEDKYRVSLYTEKEIDVSLIAQAFGGGGHKKASGFICTEVIFEEYNDELFVEIGPNE